MRAIASFDLGNLGVEKWLVDADALERIIEAFEKIPEDYDDPEYEEHDSPLDRAADAAGRCSVLAAHWGARDLPRSEEELQDLLKDVIPSDREEVANLVRERWPEE